MPSPAATSQRKAPTLTLDWASAGCARADSAASAIASVGARRFIWPPIAEFMRGRLGVNRSRGWSRTHHSFKRSAPRAMIWIKARIGANAAAPRRQTNSMLVLTPIKVIPRRMPHQNNIDRGLQTDASTPRQRNRLKTKRRRLHEGGADAHVIAESRRLFDCGACSRRRARHRRRRSPAGTASAAGGGAYHAGGGLRSAGPVFAAGRRSFGGAPSFGGALRMETSFRPEASRPSGGVVPHRQPLSARRAQAPSALHARPALSSRMGRRRDRPLKLRRLLLRQRLLTITTTATAGSIAASTIRHGKFMGWRQVYICQDGQ